MGLANLQFGAHHAMKRMLAFAALLCTSTLSLASLPQPVLQVFEAYSWQPNAYHIPYAPDSRQRCVKDELHDLIRHYADHFRLDANLVYALIYQESRCNPKAVSKAGAVGLMQLMPQFGAVDAVEWLTGVKLDRIPSHYLKDPHLNVLLGTAYLRMLFNTFQDIPDGEPRVRAVLAGYNWGPTRVRRRAEPLMVAHDPITQSRNWTLMIPVEETRDYVSRVVLYYTYLHTLGAR